MSRNVHNGFFIRTPNKSLYTNFIYKTCEIPMLNLLSDWNAGNLNLNAELAIPEKYFSAFRYEAT